ncbi:MAG: VanW family protein [Acidimicrobiia bacterium]
MADALNEGEIAPNVTVAGVHIGGMSPEDALQALRARERALRQSPAPFTVQETDFDLDPRLLALEMDEESAVVMAFTARRGGGFFDRFAAWVRAFGSTVVVPTEIIWDDVALEGVFDSWETTAIGQPANQGGVRVRDGRARPVYPVEGVGIDRDRAREIVAASLVQAARTRRDIPTATLVPRITDADVDTAVIEANRMIGAPVTLTAEDPELVVEFDRETLGSALVSTVPDDEPARIELGFDEEVLLAFLEPRHDEIEQPPRNAEFLVQSDGSVTLREGRRGKVLDISLVAAALADVSLGPGTGDFPFAVGARPEFTTAEAEAMEPIELMSSFTTEYRCCESRVTNIKLIAADINNTIVWPGQTFSLNDAVGPRTEEKGYLPAPMILAGEIVDDIGGGVSQFATTFFNAVFFGCYEDVTHTPHSYYFSRYPEGREATISWPSPDLRFRNDSDALILIKAYASDNAVTVTFYGNNGGRDCTSDRSDRRNPTEPTTTYQADSVVPPGTEIVATTGSGGWTVDVTRTITFRNGDTSSQTWTHVYQPIPTIIRVHPCDMPGSTQTCPVPVPTVVGLTYAEAQARLADAGLTIADGGTVSVGSAGDDGIVQSQSTASGVYVARGTAITVTVGVYTAPPTTTEPPPTTTPPPTTVPPPPTIAP